MNIQAEKIEIIKMVLETDNPGILETIKRIFSKETSKDFWLTLPQEEREEILKGLEEIENGEVVDYEKLIKKHR
jgi:O6-methylguanine-DNA--protein-cysteine methyltransferase